MTSPESPRPTPTDLIEGALQRVAKVHTVPTDPPGNEWNFALGILFALTTTGQLDDDAALRYEEKIQSEARRLHGAGD